MRNLKRALGGRMCGLFSRSTLSLGSLTPRSRFAVLVFCWLLAGVAGMFSPELAIGLGLLGVGAVAGDLTETSTPEDWKPRDVSDTLTLLDETKYVPLDQLMRRMMKRRKAVSNVMVEFYEADRVPERRTSVNGAQAAGAANASVDLTLTDASIYQKNDVLVLPDNATAAGAALLVLDRDGNDVTVRRLPPKSAPNKTSEAFGIVPAVVDGERIIRITNSKSEADTPSQSRITTPGREFNLVHTFDSRVTASDHRIRTKNYGPDDWRRIRRSNLIDFRRSCEFNFLFGERSVTTDPSTGKPRWTMRGLTNYPQIETLALDRNNFNEADWISLSREIFVGNAGSERRIFFVDAMMAETLDIVLLDKLQTTDKRKILGVEMTRGKTRFGTLEIVHHPGFDTLGYEYYGVVADMNHLYKGELQATEKRKIETKKTGGADEEGEYYIEKSTLVVEQFEAHRIVTM